MSKPKYRQKELIRQSMNSIQENQRRLAEIYIMLIGDINQFSDHVSFTEQLMIASETVGNIDIVTLYENIPANEREHDLGSRYGAILRTLRMFVLNVRLFTEYTTYII